MNPPKPSQRNLYYTHDHEWIDFQGSVAYIGICAFKLKGIRQIQQISFPDNAGLNKKGDTIAVISYDDYEIPVHLPVDGKIISINEALLSGNQELLLQQPENNGWVALMVPRQPYERKDLLLPEQYTMKTKKIY